MRDAALDAATDEVISRGWSGLRIRAIAEQVGISRQTLYTSFTDKHGIAQALVARHNERFLAGVGESVRGQAGLREQWAAAVRYTLRRAAEDPLFKVILDAEGSEEFLPLITSGGEPIVVDARELLADLFGELHPDLRRVDLEAIAEIITRLTLSHIVLPLHPIDVIAEQLGDLAIRFLRTS